MGGEVLSQDAHEARQHHQVWHKGVDQILQLCVERCSPGEVAVIEHLRGYTGGAGTVEPIGL